MIQIDFNKKTSLEVKLIYEGDRYPDEVSKSIRIIFEGKYLQTCYMPESEDKVYFLTGLGKKEEITRNRLKEVFAKAVKELNQIDTMEYSFDIKNIITDFGVNGIQDATEGIMLGAYEFKPYKEDSKEKELRIYFNGILEEKKAHNSLVSMMNLMKGVIFARNMVNTPGNLLRPMDFAREITNQMKEVNVSVEQLVYGQMKAVGMEALASVGKSSEYPPVFMILKYMGDTENSEIIGLVGKGVTCDTGGYCLKSSGSMLGIKGDMAGGAAVAGAIYSLAKNEMKTNVIGFIPICENRISPGSLLPGDVISSMSGKTIEIINTDAEGRLILSDAVTYAVKKEKVTKILDIATLTGAVVNMLGFSIAGVLTNNQEFFEDFRRAYKISGEKYWRLPIYPEHEKMIKSEIADIKNQGESFCGTITAGLFIREFVEERPWLHLDIAGTAWVDTPIYEYQSKGATGAGVTSIYYLCSNNHQS